MFLSSTAGRGALKARDILFSPPYSAIVVRMPMVNTYYSSPDQKSALIELIEPLKQYIAKELSCGDIILASNEVSVRLIETDPVGKLADVEFEVFAHAFSERIKQQDDFCFGLRAYIKEKIHELDEVRAWLVLSELGHSWESISVPIDKT